MPEKLVRDKVPEWLASIGDSRQTRRATTNELPSLLARKIGEGTRELLLQPSAEEAADVIEAMLAFLWHYGSITEQQVTDARANKAQERGAFNHGIVLIEP